MFAQKVSIRTLAHSLTEHSFFAFWMIKKNVVKFLRRSAKVSKETAKKKKTTEQQKAAKKFVMPKTSGKICCCLRYFVEMLLYVFVCVCVHIYAGWFLKFVNKFFGRCLLPSSYPYEY